MSYPNKNEGVCCAITPKTEQLIQAEIFSQYLISVLLE